MRAWSLAEFLAPLWSTVLFAVAAVRAWAAPAFAEWEAHYSDADDQGAALFILASTIWL